jgi:uncharacterized protein (DUF2147 family)
MEHMTAIRRLATAITTALILCGTAQAHAGPSSNSIAGTWMNPHNTVAVHTGACGEKLCGWVVWASAEAQSDARDGGTARLGGWSGTVFVPDRGQRFYSEIEPVDANAMKLKGCILHGLICRSQVWRRIPETPRG